MTRRFFVLVLLSMLVAAPALALAQEPIRVGFLTVRSGPLAAGGRQLEEGFQIFVKERNGTLSGRKLEVIYADTAGQPALTKTKTQELVERNRVHVIIGPLAAFEALAINDYIKQVEVPIVSSSAAAEDLTQRKLNPWFIRAVGTSAQVTQPVGAYAAKVLRYKRMATIADDFAYGHEGTSGFQRVFEDNGGKVVQKLWPPLNVADYGSYIAQIKPNVDALYTGFAGANGLRFLKQYAEYGLKGKIPVLGNMTNTDEGILKSMGDEALGALSAGWYSAANDTPANRKFVAAVRAEFKADPGYYTAGAYTAGLFLEAALKVVNGKIEDKPAFMKALRSVRLTDGPVGPLRLDEYGNPIMNMYIRKVERKDGRLVNSVIHTYPETSQFWTYDPKAFLANPVYSRDFPPAKNIE
ncbi:MAG: ABC transporter substrate-binding protein [Candidatus Rokubacteria bacterium]|nr:ABC transporter substrate-binding protein [Candidatus Rokubacteria bacterium]